MAADGWCTVVCTAPAVVRTPDDVLRRFLGTLPQDEELILVPHSNAGAYVPALTARRNVRAAVFVDAVLPPASGSVALAPQSLVEGLRTLADPTGLLPPWTRWWPEDEVAELFGDLASRTRVESEQPRALLSYFEQTLPVPPGWDGLPAAFLAFGDTYAQERQDAKDRGWAVRTLSGGHLHQLVAPGEVAAALLALLEQLGIRGRRA